MLGNDQAACHGTAFSGDAGDTSCTLAQSCTDLFDAMAEFASCRFALDNELQHGTEEAVTAAIDAVWIARQECNRLAEDVLTAVPETTAEASARQNVLAAYLTLPDADELMRSRLRNSILNKITLSVQTILSAACLFPYALN